MNITNREVKITMNQRTANWMAEQARVRVPTAAELAAELAAQKAEAAHNIATAASDRAAYADWQAAEAAKKVSYQTAEAVAARAISKLERAALRDKRAAWAAKLAAV